MERLKEWALDWADRAGVGASTSKIDDPIAILQRAFAAVAALVAVLSSPAITMFTPNMNPNAAFILRVLVAAVTLIAVNHVVTAKDVVDTTSGLRSLTLRKYRYSTTERLIARVVVGVALVMLALNLIPAPRDCNLMATFDWQAPDGAVTPLYASLNAGSHAVRYGIERGKSVAIQIPAAHVSSFSMNLVWSDGSQSDFGALSGCAAVKDRRSGDGRVQVDLAIR